MVKRKAFRYVNINNQWYTRGPNQNMYTWRTWCKIQNIKYKQYTTKYSNIIALIYTNDYNDEGYSIFDEKIDIYASAITRSRIGELLA